VMERYVCVACGTQFPDSDAPPERCPICEDPRQYVPLEGQRWTTIAALGRDHANALRMDGDFLGVGTEPGFAIGQRALLVPHRERLLMWDCITLYDDGTATEIEARGGLSGIAISHPHYYSSMVEWAQRFDCPIHLHALDAEWVMRPDERIAFWDGDTLDLGGGLTLIRGGGHFPGGQMLHVPAGAGTLLVGDIIQVVPDRSHVAFMWSYPNLVPLPDSAVQAIAAAVEPFEFATLQAAWWDRTVGPDAKAIVRRSAERYGRALRGELL
jgi:glyoxylase-like metal-dependent hydrolase (beta-lactamase superfamily II)